MPELSLYNIDQISRDVRKQEITFSHLLDELTDHICCDVEQEMKNGLDFSEAYRRVRQKMGSRRLKEIQEETLYAVDTKYRQMKNTMKISGIAGTVMFGFATLFKIMHWYGAAILMTAGAITLAFIFMPSALGVLWKETQSRKRLFLFITVFLAGAFIILGTLFKVQHWHGAFIFLFLGSFSGIFFVIPALTISRIKAQENKAKWPVYILGALGAISYLLGMLFKIQHWHMATFLLITGLILLCFIALPWYTWVTWKDESHIHPQFLFIIICSVALIVPGLMINLQLQYAYEDQYYPHMVQQQALYNYLYKKNKSMIGLYSDSLNYQRMEQVHARSTEMLNLIVNVQEKLIEMSEGKPGKPAMITDQVSQTENGTVILYRNISKPFHLNPVKYFLLPGCTTRAELDASFREYAKFISEINPGGDFQKYAALLDLSLFLPLKAPEKGHISMLSALHSLEIMKNSVLTVETYVLKDISSN
jgi:hypothetical protein